MRSRIRELRNDYLKITQTEFGKVLGLSQKTIANIELGTTNTTQRNFDAICRAFNVNPEWLKDGVGEVFLPSAEKSYLDKLAEEKGLDDREKALIQSIIELPPSVRGAVIEWAIALVKKVNAIPPESEKEKQIREIDQKINQLQQQKESLTGGINSFGEESLDEAGAG